MVKFDDRGAWAQLVKEYFPNRSDEDLEFSRTGFCQHCKELLWIDPPGGPFTRVANECECEDSDR